MFLGSPSHTGSGHGHVTCFGQWNISRRTEDRRLKNACTLGHHLLSLLELCNCDANNPEFACRMMRVHTEQKRPAGAILDQSNPRQLSCWSQTHEQAHLRADSAFGETYPELPTYRIRLNKWLLFWANEFGVTEQKLADAPCVVIGMREVIHKYSPQYCTRHIVIFSGW